MHIETPPQAGLEVFSFDVFDTFLLRRCTSPDGVFERTFDLAGIPAPHRHMRTAFVQHRQMAESRARAAAATQSGSAEIGIEDIYRRFPSHIFGLERADWPLLVRAEFQAETELCFVNPMVLETFQAMRRSGLRCGFMSDTYWNARRLGELLRLAAPGLEWEFLYPSCDHRTSKSGELFARMLADQGVAPGRVAHMGDNERADVRAARKHGIQAFHVPQSSPALAGIFERESAVFDLMCGQGGLPRRLDNGIRSIRRLVAASAPRTSPAFVHGVQVLGPILTAFHYFVANRVQRLRRRGGKIAVAFLARDAMLSHGIWQQQTGESAPYLEINRRIAVLASATSPKDIGDFFRDVPQLNLEGAKGFFKTETPAMRAFFAGGAVSGKAFAAALPGLLGEDKGQAACADMRRDLLAHLRARIADFDQCSDIVLVDLGYGGTVQRRLRAVLDAENLPQHLHGLYLATQDEAFIDLPEGDSAEGFISDRVLTPHARMAVLSNISIIEQLCSAPEGSVMGYDQAGGILREPDPRPPEQRELCAQAQEGALDFARAYASLPACFERPDEAAPWAAAMLARAVLLPGDDELVMFGRLHQDANLGVQTLSPLLNAPLSRALGLAKALPAACTIKAPPVWPAAGMAALSPLHGFHYALFAAGCLPGDLAGDVACGTANVLVGEHSLTVTALRTGEGDLRLRIPVLARGNPAAVIVPISCLPPRGLIRGITLQQGDSSAEAMASRKITLLPPEEVQAVDAIVGDGVYTAAEGSGHLVLPLPTLQSAVGIVTLTIAPLSGSRVLALTE